MMIMRPPQHRHGFGNTRVCSGSAGRSVSRGVTRLLGDDYRAIAPFIGIGLVVAAIAVSTDVQGVWL